SSVSHLGFVVLGIFAFHNVSMQGAVYQMLAHGISTGALFLLVGMLYDRRHTFEISEYGGLATPMPKLAAFFLFVALSSLGLPMLNGFVGEYLVLLGTYQRHWGWASWAALRSEEHTSELQSPCNLVCRLLLEKKNKLDIAETAEAALNGREIGEETAEPALVDVVHPAALRFFGDHILGLPFGPY